MMRRAWLLTLALLLVGCGDGLGPDASRLREGQECIAIELPDSVAPEFEPGVRVRVVADGKYATPDGPVRKIEADIASRDGVKLSDPSAFRPVKVLVLTGKKAGKAAEPMRYTLRPID